MFDGEGKEEEGASFNHEELVAAIGKQREGGIFEQPNAEKERAFADKYKDISRKQMATLFEGSSFALKITKDDFTRKLTKQGMERIAQEEFGANPRPSLAQASAASGAVTKDTGQSLA